MQIRLATILAIVMAAAVALAWYRDRCALQSQIAKLREQISQLERSNASMEDRLLLYRLILEPASPANNSPGNGKGSAQSK